MPVFPSLNRRFLNRTCPQRHQKFQRSLQQKSIEPPSDGSLAAQEWELPSIEDAPEYSERSALDVTPEVEPAEEPFVDEPSNDIASDPLAEQTSDYADTIEPEPEVVEQQHDIDRVVSNLDEQTGATKERSAGLLPTIVLAVLVLIIVGSLGFAGWQYRSEIAALFGSSTSDVATSDQTGDDGPVDAGSNDAASTETATEPESKGIDKFTQRLLPDGTEVESTAGPAANGEPEGKSVAQLDTGTNETPAPQQDTVATPASAETMFLYEERLGQASPTALEGSIVWSRQMESHDVGNPQPVIQAKIEVPGRAMSALLTIRKNLDPLLARQPYYRTGFLTAG